MSYMITIKTKANVEAKFIPATQLLKRNFGFFLFEAKKYIDQAKTLGGAEIELEDPTVLQIRAFKEEMYSYGYEVEYKTARPFLIFEDVMPSPEYKHDDEKVKMSLRDLIIYNMEWHHFQQAKYDTDCGYRTVEAVLANPFPKVEYTAMNDFELLNVYTGQCVHW